MSATPLGRLGKPQDIAPAVVFLASPEALGLEHVDVLGFSIGGMVAQSFALRHPHLARRFLLVGTAPRGGETGGHGGLDPEVARVAGNPMPVLEEFLFLFFEPSETSRRQDVRSGSDAINAPSTSIRRARCRPQRRGASPGKRGSGSGPIASPNCSGAQLSKVRWA